MNPALRPTFGAISLSVATILISGAPAFPQSQPAPAPQVQTQTLPSAHKPVHRLNEVPSDDTIVLLGTHRTPFPADSARPAPAVAPKPTPAPAAPTETPTSPTAASQDANGNDAEKLAAEIASLQKQIQDKTIRITFLMHLFVTDERRFLNDPSNQQVDPDSLERRKYSQNELLYESAELARLKARLNQLTAAH